MMTKINDPIITASDNITYTKPAEYSKLILDKYAVDDKPWMKYYLTADDFLELVRIAFQDSYGWDENQKSHPEDLYINISIVMETVANTLFNLSQLAAGRELRGIKNG